MRRRYKTSLPEWRIQSGVCGEERGADAIIETAGVMILVLKSRKTGNQKAELGMNSWKNRLCHQQLVIREHLNASRSDVSQTGLVQANREVSRPANCSRSKYIVFQMKKKGPCHKMRGTKERTPRLTAHGTLGDNGEEGEPRM